MAAQTMTAPLGVNASIAVFPSDFAGEWCGMAQQFEPDGFLNTNYTMCLELEDMGEATRWEPWRAVGSMMYPDFDMRAPLLSYFPVNCVGHLSGGSPAGVCLEYVENFMAPEANGDVWDNFLFGFITVSMQSRRQGDHCIIRGSPAVEQ